MSSISNNLWSPNYISSNKTNADGLTLQKLKEQYPDFNFSTNGYGSLQNQTQNFHLKSTGKYNVNIDPAYLEKAAKDPNTAGRLTEIMDWVKRAHDEDPYRPQLDGGQYVGSSTAIGADGSMQWHVRTTTDRPEAEGTESAEDNSPKRMTAEEALAAKKEAQDTFVRSVVSTTVNVKTSLLDKVADKDDKDDKLSILDRLSGKDDGNKGILDVEA